MSLAERLAAQQARVGAHLVDAARYDITLAGVTYRDVAVVPQNSEHDTDDGVAILPASVHCWIPKTELATEPAMRSALVWEGSTYRITEVAGAGQSFAYWMVKATRH